MVLERKVSRRDVLKAGAAAGTLAALSPLAGPAVLAAPDKAKGRLIPAPRVGTITFTQRDVPSRAGIASGSPTMGYLGGPGFPDDPTDLGELVPLPGGWRELLHYLADCGVRQVEFAGYGQNAANPGGPNPGPLSGGVVTAESRAAYLAYARTIRGFLDEAGLVAIGNHGFIPNSWFGPSSPGGTMSQADQDRFLLELEFASVLGMPFMGTGGDPTSANNRNIEPWTVAGEKWEALNTLAIESFGIHIYPHNHAEAYQFLADGPMVEVTEDLLTGAPIAPTMVRSSSGRRLMEYYLAITDPTLCLVELDIYWAHVAQHRFQWYYDENGDRVQSVFDPGALVAGQTKRFALYHAKDGDRTTQAPGVGNGYSIIPFGDDRSDIDFETFFRNQGAKGWHNPNYEQDNAPGGGSDPGKSLRDTRFSIRNMVELRG